MYGHDYSGNAWSYIKGYNSDPLKAIFSALSTVEKVIALIENNTGPGESVPARPFHSGKEKGVSPV